MKRVETKISGFLQSRSGTLLLVAVAVASSVSAFSNGNMCARLPLGCGGFAYGPEAWLAPFPHLEYLAGLSLSIVVGLMMLAINRTFNLLRDASTLFVGVYAVMQAATPAIVGNMWASTLLTVVLLGIMATFYTVYMRPRLTQRIFLAFCVMVTGALFNYIYALYAALFLLAFHQMRAPSARMYLAASMGMVTPVWIAFGFGLMPGGIHWPESEGIFENLTKPRLILMLVTVGFTVIAGFLVCCTNMVKIYSYNARSRALSGMLAMLTLFTATASLIDIANSPCYLPTLNCLTAFQMGLFFRITEGRRGYVYLLSLFAVCITLYFCNLWL